MRDYYVLDRIQNDILDSLRKTNNEVYILNQEGDINALNTFLKPAAYRCIDAYSFIKNNKNYNGSFKVDFKLCNKESIVKPIIPIASINAANFE